jgi:N-acetyl-anhydromuramyl-L-alanine amidase AmpD
MIDGRAKVLIFLIVVAFLILVIIRRRRYHTPITMVHEIKKHALSFGGMDEMERPNRITLHHTAGDNDTIESIHNFHKNIKGWAGIAYHYVVYKNGEIHEARPLSSVGAHAGAGNNAGNIGVCFVGNFDKYEMGQAQLDAGLWLVKKLIKDHDIRVLNFHNDLKTTACPGALFPKKAFKSIL